MRHFLSVRNLLALAILFFAVVLILWVIRNYRGGSEENIGAITPQVDLALKGFNYTETIAGRRQWTLKGEHAFHDVESGLTKVVGIDMIFYDDELGEISLKAKEGNIDAEYRVVNIRGNVLIDNPHRYQISTESLRFIVKEKAFETLDAVKITSEEMELSGQGMRFGVRTRIFELFSTVRAKFDPRSSNGH